jgi:hypothetical protein
MSFNGTRSRPKGSSVIQAMLQRLAEDERQLLEQKTVGTVPVEPAKPLVKAALY